jgi:iron complex outermembrane recepter protein
MNITNSKHLSDVGLRRILGLFLSLCTLATPMTIRASNPAQNSNADLTSLSLEELINIEVTSVSKKAQKLSDTSAAVYVITQEDIKRSGVQNIPDALRMVPGLQVARINSNKWAISARGFNDLYSNKLLVLIDGRSVYTPLFSGVFWEIQDTLMEDIDRIEVIRGPGATVWGANAVNGVINIITKNASATQGGLVTAGSGTEERGASAVRYGGQINTDTQYRIYAKYFDKTSGTDPSGQDGDDGWHMFRTGFRMDWKSAITFEGEMFKGELEDITPVPIYTPPYSQLQKYNTKSDGGHLLGRWEQDFSEKSHTSLQIYYDSTKYNFLYALTAIDTLDMDFTHRFSLGSQNDIIWGAGYRHISDDMEFPTPILQVTQKSGKFDLFSGFLQDEIGFLNNRLKITLGSKIEHNDYTGFEVQPNFRASWVPAENYSIWAAISRAVRTPSRVEHDFQFIYDVIPAGAFLPQFQGPGVVKVIGSKEFGSEHLLAYELGFRVQPTDRLSLDIATYYNSYNKFRDNRSGEMSFDMSAGFPVLVVPNIVDNSGKGKTYGCEVAADWFISNNWKINGTYTYLHDDKVIDNTDSSPIHQASLRSMLNLPGGLSFDVWCKYVGSIENDQVDAYINADVRLGLQLNDNLDLSITGQNLLESHRSEFIPNFMKFVPTTADRGFYGKITWKF